jgi:hypothetical protein
MLMVNITVGKWNRWTNLRLVLSKFITHERQRHVDESW